MKELMLGTLAYKTFTLAALNNQNEILAYFQGWLAVQGIKPVTHRVKTKHFTT